MPEHLGQTRLLDAVNTALLAIGESPVNSLEGATADVAIARNLVEAVARNHLAEGQPYNVEEDFPLMPEAFAPWEIKVPDTVLSIRPMNRGLGLVRRGNRLYDLGRKTYSFQGIGTMLFRVVWLLSWDEMPEADRHLIATRASRIFAARMVGDTQLVSYGDHDEREAEAAARRQASRSSQPNMLRDSWSVARALRR